MEALLLKPRYYVALFREISAFVKTPVDRPDSGKSLRRRVCDTAGLFVLKILLLIPISVILGLIHDPENLTGKSLAERFTPITLLLVGGAILPLVEEVCFRLSLRFRPIFLSLSSSALSYYLLTKIVFQTKNTAIDDSFATRVTASVAFGLLLFPILRSATVRTRLARLWHSHFRWIFYTSVIVFAAVHAFRYEPSWINVALLPLLCLPQLLSGVIYGYLRVSFGFSYPLLLHMSTNLIGIGLSLLPFADLLEFA